MRTPTGPSLVARLLFGSTRRAVLALLLGRPDERFYLREIVRAVGGGLGAVQRELKQLVEAGLVGREAHGHQVYFSANRDAAIFPELQAILEKTAGAVDVLRTSLATLISQGRIEVAFVYGSVASGKQTARSDVDLLAVGDASLEQMVPALRAAEARLGRGVNLIVYPANEFRDKVKREVPFLKRVLARPKLFVAGDERELARLTDAPAPSARLALRDEVTRLRGPILDAAATNGARQVRLFGSVARGAEHAESDIDFLVSLEPGRTLLDLARLEARLEELLRRPADVVTPESLRESIRATALREAVPV
jgi:predicted nucleotidyltransferase